MSSLRCAAAPNHLTPIELDLEMTLQNRVDPAGNLHADPARGKLMGNGSVLLATIAIAGYAAMVHFVGSGFTVTGNGVSV